jgi:uncharacterized membrane protein YebE (DUF533 family)
MSLSFLVQLNYGSAGNEVLDCDLARYLGVLLRVAACSGVSISERNTVASAALILADEEVRQAAFAYAVPDSVSWSELLEPLRAPKVAACLYRDACQVAWADGQLDSDERSLLAQLSSVLQLDADFVAQLQSTVEVQERARRQLVSLIEAVV